MRIKAFYPLLLAILIASFVVEAEADEGIVMEFFYHPDCAPCKPKLRLVEALSKEYDPYLIVEWQDMRFKEAREQFIAYNLSRRPAVVFNHDPSTAFYNITEDALRAQIEHHLAISDGLRGEGVEPDSSLSVVPDLTLPLVIVSGLVDGVNPCAFSLLIFFLSFMFGLRRRRRSVLGMGLVYIAGLFIGYFGLGLGILHTVSLLGVAHPFAVFGIILLTVMGVLQIRDATAFGAGLLRFPRPVVPSFKRMTDKATLPVSLLLGFIVSLCEFPCSGAVYVGILVLLASYAHMYTGFLYLVLYNIMFVAPLILLLLLATNVETLLKLDEWRVLSRRKMKLSSGAFLIALAALMWYLVFQIPHHGM